MRARQVVLREHGRLWRAGPRAPAGAPCLPGAVLDRLRRMDERLGDGETFTWAADYAKASQWVGVIHAPGLQLEILPKIDGALEEQNDDDTATDGLSAQQADDQHEARSNLLFMLAVSGDIPVRTRDLAQLATRRAPLSETLLRLFAERLRHELLVGAERRYVQREDNLRTVKGRLRMRQHIAHNAAHRERFFCAYEELGVDTALNRVFKATCRALLDATQASATLVALRDCLAALEDVADTLDPTPLFAHVHITRQSERFRELYGFCQLVWLQRSPTIRAGQTRTFSLLFDMNVVFERFIAGFLRRYVMPSLPGFELFPQATQHQLHLFDRAGKGVLRLEPDLLLRRPDGAWLVIDTKWKRTSGLRESKRADLYQLFAYAKRYQAATSLLLYPHMPEAADEDLALVTDDGGAGPQSVGTRFVRLHRDLHREHEVTSLAVELKTMILAAAGLAVHQVQESAA